ncbi:ATP-binding cassette domain-containing protein [Ideonella sp. BN130291]|uniref:ATP-binding cassette domain-containing protein n=1 Tax=Ideonella sp. BN130291 TaxID=3112940 RepID=UPI002E25E7B0|nr:ATP-binding cassette domain-containing protein [Ideonella sp. BN130291]
MQWALTDGRPLWREPLSLSVSSGRLGIVGRNGVGKSVLARILCALMLPTSGLAECMGRVHLVAPPLALQDDRTVAQAMGVGETLAAVERLNAGCATADDLLLADLQWDLPARVAQALADAGLPGLGPHDTMATLSGGERMRVALAGAMAAEADSIVLDEPSNHLDADARAWLLAWLLACTRTVVVISHDRKLLRAVDRIVELTPRGLATYGGDYGLYVAQRDGQAAAAEAALAHARNERDAALAKLRREHDALQRRHARGRRLARTANLPGMVINGMRERAEATGAREAHRHADKRQSLDTVVRAAAERVVQVPAIFLALPACRVPESKLVLQLESLRLPHVDVPPLDVTLTGPVRVALTGPNGCGKSTLLRVMAGTLAPRAGQALTAVPFSTLDQDDTLPPDVSLLDRLRTLNCPLRASELRTRLAQLRLDAPRVTMPMGHLSAGERLKAALACALWRGEPARLLLLDEPTNHLDLDTTLVLQRALQAYEGAVVVASHDEEFIGALKPTHRWGWEEGRLVMRVAG